MIERIRKTIQRHPRPLVGFLAVLVALTATLGDLGWQSSGGGPPEVITTIADQCRLDPAPVSPPPPATNYLHTCSSRIYDSHGSLVQIVGVSWFGFETANMTPDGLWARNWQTILGQLAGLGYNTLRLPFSNDIVRAGARPRGINYLLNPDLQGLTSLQIMDKVIAGARQRGLRVILDRHRPTSSGQSDLWYTSQVSEATWIANWVALARRYHGDDTIIGADLDNEPRGPATWGTNNAATDWRLAARRAGNAILAVNPHWLIFVEGIEHTGDDWYWWGGNLSQVAAMPLVLSVPNRIVYSPHDYGPDVYPQGWFKDPAFPSNLPRVWDAHWGYLARQGIAPVVLGEFGGRSVGVDAEGQWQRSLVSYLQQHHIGFISWALNPDSGDTGGILQDDWLTVQASKNGLYAPGQAAPISGAGGTIRTTAPGVRLTYHNAGADTAGAGVSFVVTLFNDGSEAIPLDQLSVRYWIGQDPADVQAVVDWATLGEGHVKLRVVPTACGNVTGYVEISFDRGAGALVGYGTTGPILVRYHHSDWSTTDPSRDHSFDPSPTDREWPRIPVYRGGTLIRGDALPC